MSVEAVPAEYKAIHDDMEARITTFEGTLPVNPVHNDLLFAPQSLLAISGRYTDLLEVTVIDYSVIPELDWFKAMGMNAVTVHINFPVLYEPFHIAVGHPENFQKFVSFYKRVIEEARARDMKVIVEAIADSASPGTLTDDYAKYIKTLSWDQWVTGRTGNAVNVATLLKPDYLTVVTEGTTEAANSGHSEADTVDGTLRVLKSICDAVKKANPSQIVGGGPASWEPKFDQMLKNAVAISTLDFVDVHVYPVNRDFLPRLIKAADASKAAGKRMMISEVWAYKVADSELLISYIEGFSRDVFSFWGPLDDHMLSAVTRFSKAHNLIAIAPFWTQQFFAGLSYEVHRYDSPATLSMTEQQEAQKARDAGQFTPTGAYWANLAGFELSPPPRVIRAPPIPSNLRALVTGDKVTLNWQGNGGTTVDFVVLRGSTLTNGYKQDDAVVTTSYTQTAPKGKTWFYGVKARDKYKQSSAPTAFISVTIPR